MFLIPWIKLPVWNFCYRGVAAGRSSCEANPTKGVTDVSFSIKNFAFHEIYATGAQRRQQPLSGRQQLGRNSDADVYFTVYNTWRSAREIYTCSGSLLEMRVEPNTNRTRTDIFQQNEPNRTNPNCLTDRTRTELSDWSNQIKPKLYALGSIPISNLCLSTAGQFVTLCCRQCMSVECNLARVCGKRIHQSTT